MTLREEIEKAAKQGKEFILPYKLNEIMKLSQKIIELLTRSIAAVSLSYSDMKIVMRIVAYVLEQGGSNEKEEQ